MTSLISILSNPQSGSSQNTSVESVMKELDVPRSVAEEIVES